MLIGSFEPTVRYVTYTYKDGIESILGMLFIVLIAAFLNMIISLIIGLRDKDCVAVLTESFLVKYVILCLYQLLLYNLHFIDGGSLIKVFFVVVCALIEGFIYSKVLSNKKHKGITVSVICNIGTMITVFLKPILIFLAVLFSNYR